MSTLSKAVSIEDIMNTALQFRASDIHIKANMAPVFRVDGVIRSASDLPVLSAEDIKTMLSGLLTPRQQRMLEDNFELDTAMVFADKFRLRVNLYHDIDSVGCAMRLIPLESPKLEELNLPKVIEQLTHLRQGLILVTGVTGAGKSTTLAAMIDAINSREAGHIYTMEDPIEFVHRPKKSIITQREVGLSTKSFNDALRSALRADPNIILLGEMRDPETIMMALRAAETGHLVLSTLHTQSAPKTIQRIIGAFDPSLHDAVRTQLAYVLKAVIAQQLIPMVDGGRMAVHEIMINTSTVQEALLRGEIDSLLEYINNGAYDGMQSMDTSIYNAYREGLIDADRAKAYALNPAEMDQVIRGASR